GLRGRLDESVATAAQVVDAPRDPFDVLLDGRGHVRQHRRAARPGDGEQVGEARHLQAEVGPGPLGPVLRQRVPIAAGDVQSQKRAGHGIEAGGEHDGVDVEVAVGRFYAGRGDASDPAVGDVDERDVVAIERLVVVGVYRWTLGPVRVAGRAEHLGDDRIVDDVANLAADELGRGLVGAFVEKQVVKAAPQEL